MSRFITMVDHEGRMEETGAWPTREEAIRLAQGIADRRAVYTEVREDAGEEGPLVLIWTSREAGMIEGRQP